MAVAGTTFFIHFTFFLVCLCLQRLTVEADNRTLTFRSAYESLFDSFTLRRRLQATLVGTDWTSANYRTNVSHSNLLAAADPSRAYVNYDFDILLTSTSGAKFSQYDKVVITGIPLGASTSGIYCCPLVGVCSSDIYGKMPSPRLEKPSGGFPGAKDIPCRTVNSDSQLACGPFNVKVPGLYAICFCDYVSL
jgi:hypothetical protein